MYTFKIEVVLKRKIQNGYALAGHYTGDLPEIGAILVDEEGKKYKFTNFAVNCFGYILVVPINENDIPKEGTTLSLEENTK